MNRHTTAALALIATAFFLSACDGGGPGAGPVRSETRSVGAFSSIDLEGTARLEVTIGSPVSLSLEGRDEFLQRLKTEVEGDTLYIRSKRRDWISAGTNPRVTLRITVPHLASLNLEGGNDVSLKGFNGGKSDLRLEGATHLKGTGHLEELTVFMAGAGHADLKDLVADDARITVAGVGSVFVHPKNSLNATMNGVGAILYTGNPREVNTHMNGLGTIARGEEKAGRDSGGSDPAIDPDKLQPEYEDPQAGALSDIT